MTGTKKKRKARARAAKRDPAPARAPRVSNVRPPEQGIQPARQGPRKELAAGIEPLVPREGRNLERPARLPEQVEEKFIVR